MWRNMNSEDLRLLSFFKGERQEEYPEISSDELCRKDESNTGKTAGIGERFRNWLELTDR